MSNAGYTIPKNTLIIPQLRYIMRDPEHWKNPEEFAPERFITANNEGKPILTNEKRFIPFGIGT